MAAEAPGLRANPEAVFLSCVASPGDVDARPLCLHGVLELPREHLFGAGGHADLLHALQYDSFVLCCVAEHCLDE